MTLRWSRSSPAEAGSERFVAQVADVPVPPVEAVVDITPEEHTSKRTQIVDVPVPLDRPGDQAYRIPADTVHRQGYCCRACCGTATGSVTIAHTGDQARRDSADTVHRQGCCRAYCDQPDQPADQARRVFADTVHQPCCRRACCDTATGPSDTDGFEAVPRQNYGRASDHTVAATILPSDSDCGEDDESPAHAVHRRNSLTSSEQEELRIPHYFPSSRSRRTRKFSKGSRTSRRRASTSASWNRDSTLTRWSMLLSCSPCRSM